MRRRQTDVVSDDAPAHLVRFRAGQWGDVDPLTAAGRWYAARDAWEAVNGPLPYLDEEPMPDAPFDPKDI